MRISIPTLPTQLLNSVPSPKSKSLSVEAASERIAQFLHPKNALVITGAGVSVDSGIKAYRGNDGYYANPNFKPLFYQDLTEEGARGHAFRQRYWTRSYLGYPPVRDALPNPTHYALATLQYLDYAPRLITQNVDGLHIKASPFPPSETRSRILELHGTLHAVHCRKGHTIDRMHFQDRLSSHNPSWKAFVEELESSGNKPKRNPDGDVDIEGVRFDDFVIPECEECRKEGRAETNIKPEVIFFGESIPPQVRDRSFEMVEESSRILLVGTTLATYSAFRLVKQALEQGKPVLTLNLGPSRTDGIEEVEKIDLPALEVLQNACRLLAGPRLGQDATLRHLLSSGVVTSPDDV